MNAWGAWNALLVSALRALGLYETNLVRRVLVLYV